MRQLVLGAITLCSTVLCGCVSLTIQAQTGAPCLVIADQDARGPGGDDMAALLVLLQSPKVELLGITIVTGDDWRDVEVAHTLRLLELMGRTDVKVYPGAAFPLVRTQKATYLAEQLYGKVFYMGAWDERSKQGWDEVPDLREGNPTTVPANEDAAHFMVRMVHLHPHQVTIFGAGPMTNIALAIRLDPHFAELARGLVIMGGSINPHTDYAEWTNAPRHEFNLWFDPEAASIVLTAEWRKITVTPIDAGLSTSLTRVLNRITSPNSNAAQYLIKYPNYNSYNWDYAYDSLAAAAWLDPAIIVRSRDIYMDVNIDHGPNYGDVLTFSDSDKPDLSMQKVHAQISIDCALFERNLVALFAAPTPHAHDLFPLPAK